MDHSISPGNVANDGTHSESPYHHLFRLMHWPLAASAVVLVATGLSLHAVARPEWSIFGGRLPGWLWPGRVELWHWIAAMVFCPALLAAIVACRGRRVWCRGTMVILFGGGLVMVVTGALMIEAPRSVTLCKTVVLLHAAVGLVLFPAALVWHLVSGLAVWSALVDSFRPFRQPRFLALLVFLPLPVLTTWLLAGGWPLVAPWRVLVVKRCDARDGANADAAAVTAGPSLANLPWDDAPPLRVKLLNGKGFASGQTALVLRALHDGREIFIRAEWDDPIENRTYTPWKKTPGGWEHLLTDADDESIYYEDKFSLVFPAERDWRFEWFGCAATCHAGGGRAYGYKGGERIIDCWHWKATRTDPWNQSDDQYWWKIDFANKDVGRYGDPKLSGGYEKNADAEGRRPTFLPDQLAHVRQGMIPADHAVPFDGAAEAPDPRAGEPETAAQDAESPTSTQPASGVAAAPALELPVGTIIPGVVASAVGGAPGPRHSDAPHPGGRGAQLRTRVVCTTRPSCPARSCPSAARPSTEPQSDMLMRCRSIGW